MATEGDAKAVLGKARAFFKGGTKSVNKGYFSSDGESLDNSTAKFAKRNESLSEATQRELLKLRKTTLNSAKNPPVVLGRVMVQSEKTLANCHEMTYVACHYANQLPVKSWVAEIDYPGNHVFCVLCDTKPTWGNVAKMKHDEAQNIWIVDVWANVFATPNEYFAKLRTKLGEWALVNKRIAWMSAPNAGGWVEATNMKMVVALGTSTLTYKADDGK